VDICLKVGCLNLLNRPEVFIPTAALIVLVLLVWAQLYASGRASNQPKNFNWIAGLVWTYLAMLFALVAVALFVIGGGAASCARGFLVLSFLVTIFNILIAIGLNIIKIVFKKPLDEPLTRAPINSGLWGEGWLLYWGFLLIGLGFISFSPSLLGVRFCWSWLFIIGLVLIGAAVVVGVVLLFRGRNKEGREKTG